MKKCPQCGADVAEASKFCTNCGYAFPAAQPQPTFQTPTEPVAPITPAPEAQPGTGNGQMTPPPPIASFNTAQAKAAGRNYWQYFVDSLLHPLSFETQAHPYFGFVSMGILAAISTFNVWHFLSNFSDALIALLRSLGKILVLFNGDSSSADATISALMTTKVRVGIKTLMGNISPAICMKFFFAFAVVVLLYLGLAYLIRHVASGDQKDFITFSVDFGRFFAPMIIVALLITIFLISGSYKFTFWFLILNAMIFNIGFIATAVYQRKKTGFDVLFVTIVAEIVMTVIVLWLTKAITISAISALATEGAKFGSSSDDINEFLDLLKYL